VRFNVTFHCQNTAVNSTSNAMIVTREMFSEASTNSSGVGWSMAQLRVLGVKNKKGWMSSIVGTEVSEDVWERFVRAGDRRRRRNMERQSGLGNGRKPKKRDFAPNQHSAPRQTQANEIFTPVDRAEREQFYSSDDWKDIRMLALRRGGYRCNFCGATKHTTILHVDHKVPLSVDWSRRLDLLNLQVLCAECNIGKRNYHSDDGDKIAGIECPF